MKFSIRFDTRAYVAPARAEMRFPVLAGQVRCATGVRFLGGAGVAEAVSVITPRRYVAGGVGYGLVEEFAHVAPVVSVPAVRGE